MCKKLLSLILILCLSTTLIADPLPDLGDYSATVLTPARERKLTHEFLQMVHQSLPTFQDPIITAYLHTITTRLLTASGYRKTHLKFILIKQNDINAFAGPSGYVGVNTGLFTNVRNENELVAVLAHESSHIILHHIANGMAEAKTQMLPTLIGLAAAAALGATGAGSAGAGALSATMAVMANNSLQFSQGQEQQADIEGIRLMANAGYNPQSMVSMLNLFRQKYLLYNHSLLETLSDHPPIDIRIANAQNFATRTRAKQTKNDSALNFSLIQARVVVISQANDEANLLVFKNDRYNFGKYSLAANRYAYALSLIGMHKYQQAQPVVKKLVAEYPNERLIQLLQLELLTLEKNFSAAEKHLSQLETTYPHYAPLFHMKVNLALASKQPQRALRLVQEKVIYHPRDANYYYMLAHIYASDKQYTRARLNLAYAYYLNDNYHRALVLYQSLQQNHNLDKDSRDIVSAQIKKIQQLIINA